MPIANFGQLKTTIADWLNRDDLTAVIPSFVTLAEAQHRREIRDYRQIIKTTLAVSTQYTNLPTGWLETIRLTGDDGSLVQIGLDELTDKRGMNDDITGTPTYFAHIGSQIEVYPTPSAATNYELTYFAKITALSADGDTNWLLTDAPDLYLYGALMQTAPYLKDDPRLAVWAGLYAQGLAALQDESERARFGGPLRMKIPNGRGR